MGISSDAYLFYGVAWDKENYEMPEGTENIWVDVHCGNGISMLYVHIKGFHFTTCRGDTVQIDALPVPSAELLSELHTFLQSNDLEYSKLGWVLVSWMD